MSDEELESDKDKKLSQLIEGVDDSELYDQQTIKEFKEAFEMFDADQSGTIDTQELGTVLKQLGQNISQAEIEEMIKEVDEDGSGEIEFDEFLQLMGMKVNATELEFMEAFKVLDRDGRQTIGVKDVIIACSTIGEKIDRKTALAIIQLVSKNQKEVINYEEFLELMMMLPKPEKLKTLEEQKFHER